MTRTSFHDVIIIGTQMAGLLAGGYLCKKKYRVLVVGQASSEPHYDHEGILIPALPTLLPPYGCAPVLDELLANLGVEDPLHLLGTSHQPSLQIVTRDQRIDIPSEPAAFEKELDRVVPHQKDQILSILEQLRDRNRTLSNYFSTHPSLPPCGFRERTRLKRFTYSLEHPPCDTHQWPELLRILRAATGFISHLDLPARSAAVTNRPMLSMVDGWRNITDFSSDLIKALCKNGADVEERTIAEEILFRKKSAVGIKVLGDSNTYNCAAIVANQPLSDVLQMIPLHRRHRRFRQEAESVRPTKSLFNLNMVLPQETLPLGMAHDVILVQREHEPLEEDNLIRIHCQPFPNRKGRTLVSFGCLIPFRERVVGREYLVPLQQRIIRAAATLIPFLEENVEGRSSIYWESRGPDEGQRSPWELHTILEADHPALLGALVIPSQTPYRNVFFSGPESIPGLGVEGQALTAWQTIRLIEDQIQLKKML